MLVKDKSTLNQGQQAAADGFFAFLLSDEKEMVISGPPGSGKSYLLGHLIDQVMPQYFESCSLIGQAPEYDGVHITATTNKAAEVLSLAAGRPTDTIHTFMHVRPMDDYKTGKSKLVRTRDWKVHERKIIFIDEYTLLDTPMRQIILEGTHKCKIIYVGDRYQLGPITEESCPIDRENLLTYELTQQMRNAGQPALMAICDQLRETVRTGVFRPIQCVPGVIDWVDGPEMEALLNQHFHTQTRRDRILAYSNPRVIEYNDHIRGVRSLPAEYGVGELLVNNTAIKIGRSMLRTEEEVEVLEVDERKVAFFLENDGMGGKVELIIRNATISSRLNSVYSGVPLPVDREHYSALLKYYKRQKDKSLFYRLKDSVPDLRPRDAATVHKSQGSTYDTTFIDVGNLSDCHQPKVAARLLYVAFSRARNRVILYGNLAGKYGGLLP